MKSLQFGVKKYFKEEKMDINILMRRTIIEAINSKKQSRRNVESLLKQDEEHRDYHQEQLEARKKELNNLETEIASLYKQLEQF